ncbi:hypothetical protein F5X99DRAFT_424731 [Biscogniauxia marginata]|nr:hypothetical protein F5X99DRAFT_424731 [Biscogniauxia marginata]
MPLTVLIIGAGIGGPALAYALRRTNPEHRITVIERHPDLRSSGLQVDLRGQGITTMRNLGLLGKVKEIGVEEEGLSFVDSRGRAKATFKKNETGKGKQAFVSEYEFMRGDLVKLLVDASLKDYSGKGEHGEGEGADAEGKGVHYEFNKTVTELSQDASGVDITFSDGTKGRYDLVVGADGQWSRTRKMLFGAEASDAAFHSLRLFCAYYTIPRAPDEDSTMKMYIAPGARGMATRSGDRPTTQAYIGMRMDSAELDKLCGETPFAKLPAERQKQVFAELFKDAGWESERLLREMRTAADFYGHEQGQVRIEHFVKGRVALLGDAGYCPSAMTGMGTTLALLGAYVLAGEIARHGNGESGENVPLVLEAYEKTLRPYVDVIQKIAPGVTGLMFPTTKLGISLFHKVLGFVETFKIDKLATRLMPEDKGGLAIPEYSQIKFGA